MPVASVSMLFAQASRARTTCFADLLPYCFKRVPTVGHCMVDKLPTPAAANYHRSDRKYIIFSWHALSLAIGRHLWLNDSYSITVPVNILINQ
jgi:hypothetical protein